MLDRVALCRAWLRGGDTLQKQYLIHISGYNLGLIMRLLNGSGTPRRWANAKIGVIWLLYPIDKQIDTLLVGILVIDRQYQGAVLGIDVVMLTRRRRYSSTR